MQRMGMCTRPWVGLWMGLMLVGCGGVPTSHPGETSSSQDEVETSPPASSPPASSRPAPTPPADTLDVPPTRWQTTSVQGTVSVATDSEGNVYALSLAPDLRARGSDDPPLLLTKTDASGKQVWSRSWTAPGSPVELTAQSLVLSPEGGLVLAYTVNCTLVGNEVCHMARYTLPTGEPVMGWDTVLVKLSDSAEVAWVRSLHDRGQQLRGMAVNSQGTVLLRTWMAPSESESWTPELSWFQSDGTPSRSLRGGQARDLEVFAFDAQDNLITGASNPLRFAKYTPDLTLLWSTGLKGPSPGTGQVTAVGVSAQGAVVASGFFQGDYNWGPSPMTSIGGRSSPFLIVAEADGTPRWGRTLSSELSEYWSFVLQAVGPQEQVVVASSVGGRGNRVTVERYTLAGERLWHHQLGATEECGARVSFTAVTSMAISPHQDVLLAGTHTDPSYLGLGCVPGSTGFVLDLKP